VTSRAPDPDPLLTPAEVAALFRVDPKTVTRWAKAGKLDAIRTLGGHRRYRAVQVQSLLATGGPSAPSAPAASADQVSDPDGAAPDRSAQLADNPAP